jgi:DNA-binding transcriptional MerR regulator
MEAAVPEGRSEALHRAADAPAYTVAEASRLAGLSENRTRRWLKGYEFSYPVGQSGVSVRRRQAPVIRRGRTAGTPYASFLDLIDLLFVKEFLNHGISLQKLRKALDEAGRLLGKRHFAHESFFTSGKNIYLEVKDEGDAIMELLTGGQWVIAPIILELAHKIEFDKTTRLARRWYPRGSDLPIVVDPSISFGRPVLLTRGVATANVYDLFLAEGENLQVTSAWLGLAVSDARAAITFEQQLAA